MTRTVRVNREQIESARLLIKISGGEDKVDPIIVKIAHARSPRAADERTAREAS